MTMVISVMSNPKNPGGIMGTHLRILSESYLMNTNIVGFTSKIVVLWTNIASALEGI